MGARPSPAARRCSPTPSSTRSRRSSRGGGGLIVLGETEQDKYGNNLNDAPRPLRHRGRAHDTVQDYDATTPHGSRRRWVLRRARRHGARATASAVDLLARVERGLLLPRRARSTLRDGGRRRSPAPSPTASPPGAPLAAVAEHGAGRVVVLADSDLFGDDCIGELDHERALAQPRLLGRRSRLRARRRRPVTDAPPLADPRWRALKRGGRRAARCCRSPTARSTSTDARRRRAARAGRAHRRRGRRRSRRRFPHQAEYLEAAPSPTCAPGPTAASAQPDFTRSLGGLPARARPRATASSTWCVFPMYKQNGSRDTLLRGADRRACRGRSGSPSSSATRYDNPKFVPVTFVDHTAGYDSECAVLFPETFARRGRPEPTTSAAIFCDREAERFRRVVRRAPRSCSGSTSRPTPPRCSPRQRCRMDAYVLWDLIHDRAHMPRRPAVRPVHDPPADAVLDVLAGGAALRPDGVRRGRRARGARASPSRATCSTRSSSTACSASRSRAPACATTTASAASSCSPTCTRRGYRALDRQPAERSTGSASPTASRALRERGRGALPHRHRPLEARPLDAPPTTSSPRYVPPADGLAWAAGAPRPARGRRAEGAGSTRSRTTSSRSACSTRRSQQKLEPAVLAGARHERRARRPRDRGRRRRRRPRARASVARAGRRGRRRSRLADRDAGPSSTQLGADLRRCRATASTRRVGRPPRRGAGAALGRATSRRASGGSTASLHLVGGWRGGEPLEEAPLEDYELLHDLLVRTVQHTTRAFCGAAAPRAATGASSLVSRRRPRRPTARQRRLRGGQGGRRGWTLALADGFTETGATANVIVVNAIVTPAMREENPDKAYRDLHRAPRRSPTRWSSSCSRRRRAKMNGQRLIARIREAASADACARSPATTTPAPIPTCSRRSRRPTTDTSVSYGDDPWTARADERFRAHFGDAGARPSSSSTAPPPTSLRSSALTRP